MARLINEARAAGLRLAIATTTTPENVEALLRAAMAPDAMNWFEVIGAGDVVPAKKPAPDIYHWVLERLELAPDACLALEDSENGLAASLGAGIPTLITENAYTRGQNFSWRPGGTARSRRGRSDRDPEIHKQSITRQIKFCDYYLLIRCSNIQISATEVIDNH